MKDKILEQLYCSVDLEFTGFDPSRDRILEIGFAFFRMTENGAEITEQWSQVFKPSIEVHPKILGLTGITLQELDEAPDFEEHREFLQNKLRDCIIVGHNPVMDVKFLESYGIKLSGKTIDTLELVQFLLPTHHSYNLENLMHYFGIAHENAHRALGDAISTVSVLENMLRIYQGFNSELQKQILGICKRGTFLWEPLLHRTMPPKQLASIDSLGAFDINSLQPFLLSENLVTIDSNVKDHEPRVALGIKQTEQKTIFVVDETNKVMHLWKAGLARAVFGPEDRFNLESFNAFLSQAQTEEELRFCLKIIVWLGINWQTDTVNDLNISFFGGQFRQFIIGGNPIDAQDNLLCCDYKTFQLYAKQGLLKDRKVIISNLQGFEKFISTGTGAHLSWNGVLYSLKMIYNPETDFGNVAVKNEVLSALASTDLFFALVYMLLHREYGQVKHVPIEDIIKSHGYLYTKICSAAINLKTKLEQLQSLQNNKDLTRTVDFFDNLFNESDNRPIAGGRIQWVTLDEENTSFHDQPLDVSGISREMFSRCQTVQFTETISHPELLSYFVERLGLKLENNELSSKESFGLNIPINLTNAVVSDLMLYDQLIETPLPAVVIFPDLQSVKNFYNLYYKTLKEISAVLAQGYSGGGNKMFRNFSIKKNSILLATPEFIAKQKYILAPKTAIFNGSPYIEISHPYIKALVEHWSEQYPEFPQLLTMSRVIEVLKNLSGGEMLQVEGYGLEI